MHAYIDPTYKCKSSKKTSYSPQPHQSLPHLSTLTYIRTLMVITQATTSQTQTSIFPIPSPATSPPSLTSLTISRLAHPTAISQSSLSPIVIRSPSSFVFSFHPPLAPSSPINENFSLTFSKKASNPICGATIMYRVSST